MLVRLEYSIGPETRYLSHLDFLRLFTRAIRRAGLPIAYSQGFNPHPKLAFGPPVAVGITSSYEYMDLELETEFCLDELVEKLSQALPRGINIIQAKEIKEQVTSLMAGIERANFEVKVPLADANTEIDWPDIFSRFLERPSIIITRQTKKGPKPKEIRLGIFNLKADQVDGLVVFRLELQVGSQGAVRPNEVIQALIDLEGIPLKEKEMQIHRDGLYLCQKERLLTPLEVI